MSDVKRAFSDEQKQERRETMLRAAATLFAQRRFEQVKMTEIAWCAGVAKGTLYVYFRTKEELFLAYAEREILGFFDGLQRRLEQHDDGAGIDAVVRSLGEAMSESPAMIRLVVLLYQVLESNTEFDRALEFRRSLLPVLEQTGAEVERHLWFVPSGKGVSLLLTIHAMALGFRQLAEPSSVMREVEREPGMEIYALDFAETLLGSVDHLLAGMEARARAARDR